MLGLAVKSRHTGVAGRVHRGGGAARGAQGRRVNTCPNALAHGRAFALEITRMHLGGRAVRITADTVTAPCVIIGQAPSPLANPGKAMPQPHGTTWPDVGLAIVEFAREDTWKFVVVLGVVGLVLWLLFPRATRGLQEAYRLARLTRRGGNQTQERPPATVGEESND